MTSVTYSLETHNNGAMRPFVPIVLVNPNTGQQLKTKALVDTGADACSFPEFIATATGHNLKGVNVTSSVSSGIGGTEIKTWKHSFIIGILDPSNTKVLKWSKLELIDCFEHNNAPPLLGVKNFLKDLKVVIDYPKKEITLHWE